MERVGLVPLSWLILGTGTVELEDFGKGRLGTAGLADFEKGNYCWAGQFWKDLAWYH